MTTSKHDYIPTPWAVWGCQCICHVDSHTSTAASWLSVRHILGMGAARTVTRSSSLEREKLHSLKVVMYSGDSLQKERITFRPGYHV